MKTAFIIHGFNGDTIHSFGPSLKQFLEAKGYKVIMPQFPIRTEASFTKWSNVLDEYKEYFDKDTIVVAHSIGNPFFIQYLYNNKLKAHLYVSVSGFCDLFTVDGREDLNNAFINFAINDTHIEYLKKSIPNRFSLYGGKDHVIPLEILKNFTNKIKSTPIYIENVGHMGNRDNVTNLPQIEDIINSVC